MRTLSFLCILTFISPAFADEGLNPDHPLIGCLRPTIPGKVQAYQLMLLQLSRKVGDNVVHFEQNAGPTRQEKILGLKRETGKITVYTEAKNKIVVNMFVGSADLYTTLSSNNLRKFLFCKSFNYNQMIEFREWSMWLRTRPFWLEASYLKPSQQ